MKRYLILCLLLAACAAPPIEEPLPPQPTLRIVAMGDSLTAGLGVPEDQAYPAQLQDALRARGHDVEVINAGISGETSSGALSRLDWVLSLDPDIIILETGANDGLRGVDPSLTKGNIDRMLARLSQENVTVVLAGMQIVQNMGPAYVQEFMRMYPELAAQHDVVFVPFFLEGVGGNPSMNQPDGVHPTAEGYAVVVENMVPYVEEAIGRTVS